MTEFERERLVMLMEECAEVQKNICKALRHGLDHINPETNLENCTLIAQELGDVYGLVDILVKRKVLSEFSIEFSRATKAQRIEKWVHHV